MSPTSAGQGTAAVKSRPIRSGLLTGCSPGTVGALATARGWQARSPSSRIRSATSPALHRCPSRFSWAATRRHPISTAALAEDPAHLDGQLAPPRRGSGLRLAAPGVAAGPRHPQQAAHPGDLVVGLLRVESPRTARLRLRPREEGRCFFRNSFSIRSLAVLFFEFLHARTLHRRNRLVRFRVLMPPGVQSGRPGESHPRAPTERSVNLSVHSALLI